MNINKEIEKDLHPIMDLFSGGDGGVAFIKFRHQFLPDVYKMNTSEAMEFKRTMKIMAKVSKAMLKSS